MARMALHRSANRMPAPLPMIKEHYVFQRHNKRLVALPFNPNSHAARPAGPDPEFPQARYYRPGLVARQAGPPRRGRGAVRHMRKDRMRSAGILGRLNSQDAVPPR